jgi:ubiquinone biosynthesis protein UbiJ
MKSENPSQDLQEIATNMSHAAKSAGGKFKSSTCRIMEALSRGIKETALYIKASRWNETTRSVVESVNEQDNVAAGISSVIDKMKNIDKLKVAADGYAEKLNMMKTEMDKIKKPLDDLATKMKQYTQKVDSRITSSDSKNESKSALKEELEAFIEQIKVLKKKVEIQDQKMADLHNMAFKEVPKEFQSGLREPKPTGPVPRQ